MYERVEENQQANASALFFNINHNIIPIMWIKLK